MVVSSIPQLSLFLNLTQARTAYVRMAHTNRSAAAVVRPGAVLPVPTDWGMR